MNKILVILLFVAVFNSCTMTNNRIDLIQENSGLQLPKSYKIIKDTTEESGLFGSDYTITIELEFDSLNFEYLKKYIPEKSTLWKKCNDDYSYYKELDRSEYVSILINFEKRTLIYKQVEI